ncbi:hypothetical protein Cgig2_001002 [Carnegiea gigantea]|uniref:Uncharacterized protein n=1 Tax=Carnegiea gigantea TaxID=171969 RepID=A0A9Q1GUV3_9CARY|nr:hypothetical protein Cgig2_001002 [Carnegiea gigantea]
MSTMVATSGPNAVHRSLLNDIPRSSGTARISILEEGRCMAMEAKGTLTYDHQPDQPITNYQFFKYCMLLRMSLTYWLRALYAQEIATMDKLHLQKSRLESFYITKSKEDWLCLRDSNEKFFFEAIKQRPYINRISSVIDEEDNGSWDHQVITHYFITFYENFLRIEIDTSEMIDDNIINKGYLSVSLQATQTFYLW